MTISCTTDTCEVKSKNTTVRLRLKSPTQTGSYLAMNEIELPGPGEYEVGEVFAEVSPTLAHFHLEDMVLVIYHQALGEVSAADLSSVERADMLLLVPVEPTKERIQALLKLSTGVEPKLLVLTNIGDVNVKELEGQAPEVLQTLKVIPKDLPEEGQRFYVLTND